MVYDIIFMKWILGVTIRSLGDKTFTFSTAA